MSNASCNALKGYTYQHQVLILMVSIMDTEREIQMITSETEVNHGMDDINLKFDDKTYYIQVKNYSKTNTSDIKCKKEGYLYIKGIGNIELSDDGINIFIINSNNITTNSKILNLDAYNIDDNIYIIPLVTESIYNKIENMYDSYSRISSIMNNTSINTSNAILKISIEDLPKLSVYNINLQNNTLMIRDPLNEIDSGILYITGKPGVGKSHYVNEIKEKFPDAIVYRFWISDQDKDYNNRLDFDYFLLDLTKKIFNTPKSFSKEELINKINEEKLIIIIDGLDHIENYRNNQLDTYIEFINQIAFARVVILSRPLKKAVHWKGINLENWNEKQTNYFLEKRYSFNYSINLNIYKISKGYPLLTYYIAEDYKINEEFNIDNEIKDISEYYKDLIKNDKIDTTEIFLCNTSFFLKEEIKDYFSNFSSTIIFNFIDEHPYLFNIQKNRIAIFHDSLNNYLKEIVSDTNIKNDIIQRIKTSILEKEIRYLSRINNLDLDIEFLKKVLILYSDMDVFKELLDNNFDYESIKEFYSNLKWVLDKVDPNTLDIYQYYSLICISIILDRTNLDDYPKLLYQILEYCKNNNITEKDIFSQGSLWKYYNILTENNSFLEIKNKNILDNEILYDFYSEYTFFDILDNDTYSIETDNFIDDMDYLINKFVYEWIYNKESYYYDVLNGYINNNITEKTEAKLEYIWTKYQFEVRNIDKVNFSSSNEMIKHILKKAKWNLYELGLVEDNNILLNKTLKQIMKEASSPRSSDVYEYVLAFIRLKNYKNEKIDDINSIGYFYNMYQFHKDYSVTTIYEVILLLENKGLISSNDSVRLLISIRDMSEEGIELLLTDYINLKEDSFIQELNNIDNNLFRGIHYIDVFNLEPSKINQIDKKFLENSFKRKFLSSEISYSDLVNVLESDYKDHIFYLLKIHNKTVKNVPNDKEHLFTEKDYLNYELEKEDNMEYKPFDNNCISEEDFDYIKNSNISAIELAKYTNHFFYSLPYVELFENYPIEELQNNYLKIIHTLLTTKVLNNLYFGDWSLCIGNIPELLSITKVEVEWNKMKDILFKFLDLSEIF